MMVKTWVKDGKERIYYNQNTLTIITADDRISELKAHLENAKIAEPDLVPFDLVITPIATGGKAYITWVHEQTALTRAEISAGEGVWATSGALAKLQSGPKNGVSAVPDFATW
jgi:hypothetical protein